MMDENGETESTTASCSIFPTDSQPDDTSGKRCYNLNGKVYRSRSYYFEQKKKAALSTRSPIFRQRAKDTYVKTWLRGTLAHSKGHQFKVSENANSLQAISTDETSLPTSDDIIHNVVNNSASPSRNECATFDFGEVDDNPVYATDDIPLENTMNNDVANNGSTVVVDNFTSTCAVPFDSHRASTSTTAKRTRQSYVDELHMIFACGGVKTRTQNALLQFFRSTPPEIFQTLPRNHITLRPPRVPFIRRKLPPGELYYFGIKNILTMAGVDLFDPCDTEILLSVNIDGLPLFHDSSRNGFWPILACPEPSNKVFLVGFYSGPGKPICPNDFIEEFVKEVDELTVQGLQMEVSGCSKHDVYFTGTTQSKMYNFKLYNLLLDLPAMAYILGFKGHGGYSACPRCWIEGEQVVLRSSGLSKKGKLIKRVRYLQKGCPLRTHDEFRKHYIYNADTEKHKHVKNPTLVPDQVHEYEYDEENGLYGLNLSGLNINEEMADKNDLSSSSSSSSEDDDVDVQFTQRATVPSKEYLECLKKHHLHPTTLSMLNNFDLVKDVPFDYLHIICIGIIKQLLSIWTQSKSLRTIKLSKEVKASISRLLLFAKKYFPCEFQRQSDTLEHVLNWKATQMRSFAMYIGTVVLRGKLHEPLLRNFNRLVYAMRILTMGLHTHSEEERSRLLEERGNVAESILLTFLEEAIQLYGAEFAVLKVHLLSHIVEDYKRFGPSDSYSCFKFESFLARIKQLVRGHSNPGMQIVNNYHVLLNSTKKARITVDSLDEYYETPLLKDEGAMLPEEVQQLQDFLRERQLLGERQHYTLYKQMLLKAFCLRTDKEADCYCTVSLNGCCEYMKVCKIVHESFSGQTFICGNLFKESKGLFSIPSASTNTGPRLSSRAVGMSIGRGLTENLVILEYSQIIGKCFVMPMQFAPGDECIPVGDEFAIVKFLH